MKREGIGPEEPNAFIRLVYALIKRAHPDLIKEDKPVGRAKYWTTARIIRLGMDVEDIKRSAEIPLTDEQACEAAANTHAGLSATAIDGGKRRITAKTVRRYYKQAQKLAKEIEWDDVIPRHEARGRPKEK